jgi:hypothetical protein
MESKIESRTKSKMEGKVERRMRKESRVERRMDLFSPVLKVGVFRVGGDGWGSAETGSDSHKVY